MLEVLREINCPIIVEGKDDEVRLRQLGVENIIPLNGKSLYDLTFNISKNHDKVVILTDFDHEGRKIAGKINSFFQSMGVRTNGKIRKEIMQQVTKKGKSAIENLQSSDLRKD